MKTDTNTKTTQPPRAPTAAELREKYSDAYAWVDAQPGIRWDFVMVPIESIATLISPCRICGGARTVRNMPDDMQVPCWLCNAPKGEKTP